MEMQLENLKKRCGIIGNKSSAGFTLMEFIVVIAVVAILAATTVPFYRTFYIKQQLNSTTDELVANLRRAQAKAMASEEDSAWGIRWENGYYVIYAVDDASLDEKIDYPDSITIDPPSDIIFNQLTGTTDTTGEITLNETNIIEINAQGRINKE